MSHQMTMERFKELMFADGADVEEIGEFPDFFESVDFQDNMQHDLLPFEVPTPKQPKK